MEDKKILALVKKASRKNKKAFAELCELKVKEILFLCAREMGSGQDAQDAAQEVFIQMQKSIERLRAPEAFNVWLNRLVYFTCQKMKRDNMKHKDMLDTESFEDFIMDETLLSLPQDFLESDEQKRNLVSLIDRMPEKYRTPVVLHYYQNLTYKDISRVTGMSQDAVNNSMRMARKYLRLQLEQDLPSGVKEGASVSLLALGPVLAQAMADTAAATSPALASQCLAAAGVYSAFAGAGIWGAAGLAVSKTLVQAVVFSAVAVAGTAVAVGVVSQKSEFAPAPVSAQADQGAEAGLAQQPQGTGTLKGRVYLKNKSQAQEQAYDGLDGVLLEVVKTSEPGTVVQRATTKGGADNGAFSLGGLPSGEYSIRVTLPPRVVCTKEGAAKISGGLKTLESGWLEMNGTTQFTLSDNEIAGLDIEADVDTSLTGRLQLKLGGAPIQYDHGYLPGVAMQLLDPQGVVVAAAPISQEGDYQFTDPMVAQNGEYTLHIYADESAQILLEIPDAVIWLEPGFR